VSMPCLGGENCFCSVVIFISVVYTEQLCVAQGD
jgi:hypothetical protein